MAETLTLVSERVDDMPVLLAHLARLGLQPLLDGHFPTHGNWVGLSLGWVSVLWLTHILSEGDHRLNHVAPWAKQRLYTLQACTGQPVHPLDVSDDRLATVLEALSDDTRWNAFEGALNQHTLRVYDLQPACVRLDSTTANGHWSVTEDGLFQFGHSKDHRPDLPQVKIMVSALDPLGMPVATDVVPGQRADDPLYIPAITRVREGLRRRGLLYVGDCKMGALETRAFIQAGGDYYLCPLSETQLPPAVLADSLTPVWTGEQPLSLIHRPQPGGPPELIAEGFEQVAPVTAEVAGHRDSWQERRLVIRSCQLAQAGERRLRGRLAKAQAEITALNTRGRGRRRWGDPSALREAVDALLTRSGARPAARPVYGTLLGAPPAALWWPGHHRTAGVGRPGDRQPQPGGRGRGGAPVGLAGLCHDPAPGRALHAGGGPGLPQRVPGRAGHGPSERAPLVVDADVSRAGRPCDRVDPPVVPRVAGPDAAGVWRAPALGHGQDPVGRAVRRQPEAGDGSPDGGTPPGGLSRPDADPHPRRPPAAVSSDAPLAHATAHSGAP